MPGEILSLKEIVQLVGSFGVSGLVVLLWWLGRRHGDIVARKVVTL